ncbi:hypothetical protein K458DRAFT_446684 [Lentithecium fluviatile CBS 122367]|uniref:Uncharacterized protein n=1 Tax=Lentithecium fluviatile CBS 122367 TaxID=1168545 RepID=A0A6G1II82_9PLEO|nr:hypothetical protein K458DRAFT_446684 [Lentithecium fluviatile CBS 122367]
MKAKYPGLGLPLRYDGDGTKGYYPHGSCRGANSDLLTVREVAMMSIMETLTDKEDWHKKVFDERIVAKWHDEALAIEDIDLWNVAVGGKLSYYVNGRVVLEDDHGSRQIDSLKGILTDAAFQCCIHELRRKAAYYEKSGIIPTLDAYASVAKSDILVTAELHDKLREAFETLQQDQASSPDWHPKSNDMVQDLVHPSMYPLVYGRSRVVEEELVGVDNAVKKWAGKGTAIEKIPYNHVGTSYGYGGEAPSYYWSDTYQWLPANVFFQDDGSVKFTSYVNNLHPTKYPGIYHTIEKLIETSLPMWDQCLAFFVDSQFEREGAGRMHSRFSESMPENMDDENPELWTPSDPKEAAKADVDWEELRKQGKYWYNESNWRQDEIEEKWRAIREPKIPEPVFESIEYAPDQKCLIDRFRKSGLQIIVKMASIELTPDKPEFPAGGWHVEGQLNEHICATALYYLDSENITPSNLSFRMQTSSYLQQEVDGFDVGQDAYHWLERVYGTGLGVGTSPCIQNYGSVETRQGRLLAFPNVFQHRVSPFQLVDPTKPGHRRFIALWLVDPTRRIISTANVPPQQQKWWLESVLGSTAESRHAALSKLPPEILNLIEKETMNAGSQGREGKYAKGPDGKLPPELMEMVRDYFEDDKNALLMSEEEAEEHRLKLMEERGNFVEQAGRDWQESSYSFCEH